MPAVEEKSVYAFEGFRLDAAALELRDPSGAVIDASPTVVELLVFLVRHRGRVVSKEELTERLWPDVVVNDNALAQHIWAARKAVGDAGREQRIIKNVRGRGYRWVLEVTERSPHSAAPSHGPAARREPGSFAPGSEFVGRAAELVWLSDLLRETRSGEGRIALVAGDAGIGKTRLLGEVARVAASLGFVDVVGRCHDDDGMPPFWPWKQALGELERKTNDAALERAVAASAADLSRLMPSLRARLGEGAPVPAREADDDRYYLFQAVTEFVRRAAAEAPLLFALDDLHWADLPSLQLLKFLAPHVGTCRILLVCAYRGSEFLEDRRKLLDGTARNASVRKLALGGLDLPAVEALLARTGVSAPRPSLERIHALTGGNPLFVAELGASFVPASSEPDAATPDGLSRVIERRLAFLRAPTLELSRAAAVLGQEFRLSDLLRSSREPADEVVRLLGALVEQRIVELGDGQVGAYRFTHPLVREAVYQGLGMEARAQLHARTGAMLEALPADQAAQRVDEIAHHYLSGVPASSAGKAAEYARRAAERAFESAAFEESVRLYRRGLEVLDFVEAEGHAERNRLLLGLGHALRVAAAPPEAVRAPFAEVAEAAGRAGDSALFAQAALGYAGDGPVRLRPLTEMGAVDADEIDYLSRANVLLGEADAPSKALVLALLARALYHAPDPTERDRVAREAVAMARRLGDAELVARTLLVKQQVLRTPHFRAERLADLTETVTIADSIGARELQIDTRHERAWVYVELGRFDEAEADMHRIGRLADELSQVSERRVVDAFQLSLAYVRENVDEIEQRDLARFMQRKTAYSGQAYGVRLLMARYMQDRADETIPLLEDFARKFPLPGSWHCALASTYATVGRLEDARRELEAIATAGYSTIPRTHDWLASFTFLANAAQILGSTRRARELRDVIAPFESNVIVLGVGNFIGGLVSRTLGDLHRLLGDVDEAERCYGVALEIAERLRSPILVAWIAVDRAELYVRSEEARDLARATILLESAAPVIDDLGVALLRRRARALLREIEAAGPAPSATQH